MYERLKRFLNWLLHRHKKEERAVLVPDIKGLISKTSFDQPLYRGSFEGRVQWELSSDREITEQERQKDAEANEKYRREHEGW